MKPLAQLLAENYHRRVGNGIPLPARKDGTLEDELAVVPAGEADHVELEEAASALALLTDDVCRRCVISKISRDYLRTLVKTKAAA